MTNKSYNLLKGKFLINDDSFKYWRVILFISVLALIMIASSHSVDKKVHKIAQLSNESKELRSMFVDWRSKLMHLKMESTILEKVSDKGLKPSKTPPTKIIVSPKK